MSPTDPSSADAPQDLQGKVAIITGGNGDIGAAIALELGNAGASLVLTYRSDEDGAARVLSRLRDKGIRVEMMHNDVTVDPAAPVDVAITSFGRIDIVVANAGIGGWHTPIDITSREDVELSLAVHAVGPHQLLRAALPHLREHERSDFVYVSSAATNSYRPTAAPYAMGKSAGEALTRTLAREERQNGLHANIVAPGIVDTKMGANGLARLDIHDASTPGPDVPFGRICSPEEVASVVGFLVGDGGSYLTDQRIVVDAGGFAGTWTPRRTPPAA